MWKVFVVIFVINLSIVGSSDLNNEIEGSEQCTGSNKEAICLTPGCIHAASDILGTIDETINPCEDFYQFTCGKFLEETIIPDDKISVSRLASIQQHVKEQLKAILEESSTHDELRSFSLVKDFYNSCMNTTAFEEDNLATVKAILKELGGCPVLDNNWKEDEFMWETALHKSRALGFSFNWFLSFDIIPDFHNSSRYIIAIDQGQPRPYREVLVQGFTNGLVEAFYNYLVDLSVIFGATKEYASKELKGVLLFQMELANIMLPDDQRSDFTASTNMMTVSEIQQRFPSISWRTFLNNLANISEVEISDEEVIDVCSPKFISDLELLLARTPKRIQANYIMFNILLQIDNLLTKEVRDRAFEFERVEVGTKQIKPRWEECTEATVLKVDAAVGALYVRRYADKDVKKKTEDLVTDLRNTFIGMLKQVEWMDEDTRSKAIEKAKTMVQNIAYPEEFLDDNKLEDYYKQLEPSTNYLNFFLNAQKFKTDNDFRKLRKSSKRTEWTDHSGVTKTDAFNNLMTNGMIIPIGILYEPVFKGDRPNYMNYGGLGFAIGHEITHGFDSAGKQFDKDGLVINWWNEETSKLYTEKAQCIIEQYGNYTVPEINMNVNGILTQGENIADNGGMREAYLAYEAWVARNGEEARLPGLHYTPKQLFWISAANVWCTKERKEYTKMRIITDAHPPPRFRILGTFSNNEYFAKDFNCPAGSTMNPKRKCNFW